MRSMPPRAHQASSCLWLGPGASPAHRSTPTARQAGRPTAQSLPPCVRSMGFTVMRMAPWSATMRSCCSSATSWSGARFCWPTRAPSRATWPGRPMEHFCSTRSFLAAAPISGGWIREPGQPDGSRPMATARRRAGGFGAPRRTARMRRCISRSYNVDRCLGDAVSEAPATTQSSSLGIAKGGTIGRACRKMHSI